MALNKAPSHRHRIPTDRSRMVHHRAGNQPMRFVTSILVAFTASLASAAPPPPVTALAYSPDGTRLAVGTRGGFTVVEANGGAVTQHVTLPGPVTALAWSRDSTLLAAAGGAPAQAGEVRIYRLPATA